MGYLEGIDAYIHSLDTLGRLAPGLDAFPIAWLALDHCGGVRVMNRRGQLADGGMVDDQHVAVHMVEDGRIARIELFEEAESERAVARFEELRSELR